MRFLHFWQVARQHRPCLGAIGILDVAVEGFEDSVLCFFQLRHIHFLWILAEARTQVGIGFPQLAHYGAALARLFAVSGDMERDMLLKTLAHYDNNKCLAARALGITARTVYNRLQRYQMQGLVDEDLLH